MKSGKYCEFGKVIYKRLAELNMTQKALAEKIHCQRCQISCYARGINKPTVVTLMKLCLALDLDLNEMAELLERDGQTNE